MDSLSPLTFCLQLCLLLSPMPVGSSLWGKKVQFNGRPCLWQLSPDVEIPGLQELSVCVLLRRSFDTEWTGFIYKPLGERHVELGLQGSGSQLSVWLFGQSWIMEWELKIHQWYSVCLTWSSKAQRLRAYVNGTLLDQVAMKPNLPQTLAPNGTLTLGVSHYVGPNDVIQPENGNNLMGEIGLFRIWSREWSSEELRKPSCADGDVVRWDLLQWKHSCPPVPDHNLHCDWSLYKIQQWITINSASEPGNCSVILEEVTRTWLEKILAPNFSVHHVVSSPSHSCPNVNNSAAQLQPQGPSSSSDATCQTCFSSEVYVNVVPAMNVELVQADVSRMLSVTYSHNFLNLTSDTERITVQPVDLLPVAPEPPTTVGTSVTTTDPGPPAHPANVSSTRDPEDLNETAVRPDTFFRVNVTLRVSGAPENPKNVIEKWLDDTLERNGTMVVLNLIIKENNGRWDSFHSQQNFVPKMFAGQQRIFFCSFHVREFNANPVDIVMAFMNCLLRSKYEDGSTVIETTDVTIKHIFPENCLESNSSTIYGEYIWPETFPQDKQEMGCKKPKRERAYRLCELSIETDRSRWAEPDMSRCAQLVTISDLENITVTDGNAAEVVDVIQSLVEVQLGNSSALAPSELNTVTKKLNEVVEVSVINPDVGSDIVNIISQILLSKTDMTPVGNTFLNMTDRMGEQLSFQGESESITAPSLAMSMVNVDTEGFKGLTFGVSSASSLLPPKTFLNKTFWAGALPDTNATVSLPSELRSFFTRNKTRLHFQFYAIDDLFQDPDLNRDPENHWTVNSYVVSADVNSSHIRNLTERVVVILKHREPKLPGDIVQCVFWDFQKNRGVGGWNSDGCETSSSPDNTVCLCDHLTHFALLLDVSRRPIGEEDSYILTVISYLGCGISSIFLGITLLTYLAFEKLRRDYPSKILINLAAALLGLSMLFLLDSWLSSFSNYALCITTAATLHYFLLASFTWMGLEALHMYFALVKVFNTYVPSYILKVCAVGWGIPLVIISLVLAIDKDAYGDTAAEYSVAIRQSGGSFCWLQNDVFFYVTVVAFVLLILLCNISVFIVVLIQIRRMRANKPSMKSSLQHLKAVASLTVLLGLTWSMGFFSFGPGRVVLMYLFSIFNTLQGFFVFVFHCLMKENVRKEWRIHLCCGRFRLADYSDWSCSATAAGRKKNHLINSDSLASDNTSTRKISDSSGSAAHSHHHHHHQGA